MFIFHVSALQFLSLPAYSTSDGAVYTRAPSSLSPSLEVNTIFFRSKYYS